LDVLGAGEDGALPEPFAWLNRRWTILAALGRIVECTGGDSTARVIAADLCLKKPRAKVAAARLRAVRLGRLDGGGEDAMHRSLARFLDRYRAMHPGLSCETVLEALNLTYCTVQDVVEKARQQGRETATQLGHNGGPPLDEDAA
jgi:hypothetical protein